VQNVGGVCHERTLYLQRDRDGVQRQPNGELAGPGGYRRVLDPEVGTTPDISNPTLNSPYLAPEQYFEIGPNGPAALVGGVKEVVQERERSSFLADRDLHVDAAGPTRWR